MPRSSAVLVALSLMTLCGVASAAPSLLGPTGMILTPTASTVGMAEFDLGVSGIRSDDAPDETIVYGNVGPVPGLEVGVSQDKRQHAEGETLLNAKLRLFQPPLGKLTLSAGMIDIADQIDRTSYVVLSHVIGAGVITRVGPITLPQVHIGIGNGRLDRVFGGVSTVVDRRVEVMAEYDGHHVNLGARVPLALRFSATVAGLDGLSDLAAGLSFSSPW